MSRVLEQVATLKWAVDARLAVVKGGLEDLEAMIQMVRGFGVDKLKKQFDDWRTTKTKGLTNVVLHGVAFSVLDEWALGCSKPKKVADVLKAVIYWGLHWRESLKYKQLAGELLDVAVDMVAVFLLAQSLNIWTSPNYTYGDMKVAIGQLAQLHRKFRPGGAGAADNHTSAAAAGTAAAEAADDGGAEEDEKAAEP